MVCTLFVSCEADFLVIFHLQCVRSYGPLRYCCPIKIPCLCYDYERLTMSVMRTIPEVITGFLNKKKKK
jgi:hypothetical protein